MSLSSIGDALTRYTQELQKARIDTARLDCLVLMEDVLGKNRAHILAHSDEPIANEADRTLQQLINRRKSHEPLAYIRGTVMFHGRCFKITPSVLTPRPETETIIDLLKQQELMRTPRVADIGTGSGCIGITTSLEIPTAHVDLYDISNDALRVAAQNATSLKAHVGIYKSDLLKNLQQSYDVLLANLPYVPKDFPINDAAHFEPALALFAGYDGLQSYQAFWAQVSTLADQPTLILTEAFPDQHHYLAVIARQAGYALESTQGFVQVFARIY